MHIIINFGNFQKHACESLDQAVDMLENERDNGNDGFGWNASDMRADCGLVYEGRQCIAMVQYNGRVEMLA